MLKISLKNRIFVLLAALSTLELFQFSTGLLSTAHAACTDAPAQNVNWEGCRKRNLIMADFNFSGANFSRTDLSSSDLRNVRLVKANMFKANLVRASLAGANATSTNFESVVGSRTNFKGAILKKTIFRKAEISRADFTNTELKDVDMSKGELSRVKFTGAQLENVNFDYTNLARSDLRGALIKGTVSMKGTFMFRTNIESLDISQVSDLQNWQLAMACGNKDTILPAGLDHPENWPCVADVEDYEKN